MTPIIIDLDYEVDVFDEYVYFSNLCIIQMVADQAEFEGYMVLMVSIY